MPDPTEPGWRPEYTGDDSLGDVHRGSDSEHFGAHLYYLYRAGRNELPGVAATYAELTQQIHGIKGMMEAQFDRPGRGMDRAHGTLRELRDVTHDVLRKTCLRMLEVGEALVNTADSYAATDQAGADEFAKMLDENAEDYQTRPPYVSEPPRVHDPVHGPPPPGEE
jgi:hypothetical protein